MRLTATDRDLVAALSTKVRMLTREQVASGWFGADLQRAQRRLRALAPFVKRFCVTAAPIPKVGELLFRLEPQAPLPDCEKLSYRFASRVQGGASLVTVYEATARAKQLYGGAVRRSKTAEALHDLCVSEVYVRLRERDQARAQRWHGEDSRPAAPRYAKVPDAVIEGDSGEVEAFIEVGGSSYTGAKIRELCQWAQQQDAAIELY